jgi:hypothetical protein
MVVMRRSVHEGQVKKMGEARTTGKRRDGPQRGKEAGEGKNGKKGRRASSPRRRRGAGSTSSTTTGNAGKKKMYSFKRRKKIGKKN